MKKKERRKLYEVDKKYGLPKGTTARIKESGIIKRKENTK